MYSFQIKLICHFLSQTKSKRPEVRKDNGCSGNIKMIICAKKFKFVKVQISKVQL